MLGLDQHPAMPHLRVGEHAGSSFTGPAGTSAVSSRSSHSATVRRAKRASQQRQQRVPVDDAPGRVSNRGSWPARQPERRHSAANCRLLPAVMKMPPSRQPKACDGTPP
jgi:hypothetical protein